MLMWEKATNPLLRVGTGERVCVFLTTLGVGQMS